MRLTVPNHACLSETSQQPAFSLAPRMPVVLQRCSSIVRNNETHAHTRTYTHVSVLTIPLETCRQVAVKFYQYGPPYLIPMLPLRIQM